MLQAVQSLAALQQGAALQPWSYEVGPLGSSEVDIRVTHCGICHTDLHLIDNDLGVSVYPLVPGHEIVGTVTAVGNGVRNLQTGQRVGVGWQRGSCGQCEWCRDELENLCTQSQPTCLAGYGGFATSL
ncbi:MAG: alcohol dehydrogenase catalytic domain-containing protein, partial [Candidatus Sulfotelmatobacter sp.]